MHLYIATRIQAPLDLVWRRTRDLAQHQRWDLRFTAITPDPGADPEGAQRFTYTTGRPPLTLTGHARTTAERRSAGAAVSALRFWSHQRHCPIASGAGHWRYTPLEGGGVDFATAYRYRVRGGTAGRLADRWLLGPLLGWATAWSFDRLRLWCERGTTPEALAVRAVAEAGVRAGACAVLAAGAPWPLALAGAAAVWLVPPAPGTPAARRCRRRPERPASPAPAGAAGAGGADAGRR
ncbi:hypothetical protein [Streptomonospora mangrovi]|uniref:hypothetical protein n=1 Tax=Streptomonospora mangrovi TaxID=2883123 RepID=UPI0022DD1582|nr:hypothetical protein [Streptomonospora mangrovi]